MGSALERTPLIYVAIFVSAVAFFVKTCVSLHPYSGAATPPLYGDFEAQRHWMEITYNLPAGDWYFNTTLNDLDYWGLDYPPLTAYHSWLCGAIAHRMDPQWVALGTSRGFESSYHKLFMRYTVLVTDLLVYFTAAWAYVCLISKGASTTEEGASTTEKGASTTEKGASTTEKGASTTEKTWLATALLMQPALILIDHGHFQYNCASLGLALWGIVGVVADYDLVGSMAFTLALNFKQMELYHSLPFFCYLLGKALRTRAPFQKVISLGATVVLTFAICWLPFLMDLRSVVQVLHRQFPFERGLFEDKVANLWCSISALIKVRYLLSPMSLMRLTLFTTLLALLPSSWTLLRNPSPHRFLLALVNSSLAFFLFSFQVHEKSVLLACLPVSLLAHSYPFISTWFGILAAFSMYPLLLRDGLALACWCVCGLFFLCSLALVCPKHTVSSVKKALFAVAIGTLVVTCGVSHVVPPPSKYPHLFPLGISIVSCLQLLGFLGYFNYLQIAMEIPKKHSE